MPEFKLKHHQTIAEVIAKLGDPDARMDSALLLADMFIQDNPRFDSDKFLAACDVVRRGVRA